MVFSAATCIDLSFYSSRRNLQKNVNTITVNMISQKHFIEKLCGLLIEVRFFIPTQQHDFILVCVYQLFKHVETPPENHNVQKSCIPAFLSQNFHFPCRWFLVSFPCVELVDRKLGFVKPYASVYFYILTCSWCSSSCAM